MDSAEDISNAAKGHKANLSNPNTSEASKAHSKEVLESLGGEQAFYSKQGDDSKDPGNVERGLKAAVTNESIGESGTKQAQEKLDKM